MDPTEVNAFFVYGTLKRSFLRGGLWPRRPLRILSGTIQSDLYDLGPYPAAAPGKHWLLGEMWEFNAEDMDLTIRELDAIEGFSPHREHNEYVRQVVTVEYEGTESQSEQKLAYAYFAARSRQIEVARPIKPFLQFMGRPVAAWPDSIARVPASFSEE